MKRKEDDGARVTGADAITLEIIAGAVNAAQDEMGALLERTAMSPMIREKKDYWTALYDAQGRMVAGTLLPLFGRVLEPILAHYPVESMRPGDIYWYNDCYGSRGAITHSPDQLLLSPVFVDGELCGFVQSWAHLTDIGGATPGSLSPQATSHFQEGIIVPPVRLYREGVANEELLRVFERNTRFPVTVRGDMRALVAALRLGERRFTELLGRFGRDVVADAFAQIQDRSERRARALMKETFRPGSYEFEDYVDNDGAGGGPYAINVRLEITNEGKVIVDTTKTADQSPGPINYIMNPVVPSLILGIYLTSRDPLQPLNDGLMRLVDEVRVREGSLLQPVFPAPVGLRSLTWLRLQSAFMGLFNIASEGNALAASPAYSISMLRGTDPASAEPFLAADGCAVGYAARPFSDGLDAVYFVAQKNYPAEFVNTTYPVRLRHYGINTDTGGPGRWRGGCGVVRELEVLADDVTMSIRLDSTRKAPWGVAGGMSGRVGRATINPGRPDERRLDPLADQIRLRKHDIVRLETGGGGGHGHPYDRPAESVQLDVMRGFVSPERARLDYGVALAEARDGFVIDEAQTARLRATRTETRLFHRETYVDRI
ncbi:Acetophenone carboxylase delta subunit [Pandoraea captiosa]|uniref:Acetophenone carboxylase delta subunit n=1 Tax=Pandoraea captiosa TaxID=2508302 RepID=A0A5E4ZJZ3_9BURK|nr:hydantoinase B/oxoprolinase family protein [Pandoraea captiosa]VVE61286.1 Acetophenone carboxylase delta subunit [Pandoraea captiosa]